MPRPTNKRIEKATRACTEAVAILCKHPEFDQFNPEDLVVNKRPEHYTTVTADIGFLKSGKEIFRNPARMEDHDWPDLVGTDILEKAAKEAAKKVGLRITSTVKTYVSPNEKGWVNVGYKFLHQRPATTRQNNLFAEMNSRTPPSPSRPAG